MNTADRKRQNGLSKRADRHVQQLLALPRMQAAISEMFAEAGLATQDIVGEIAAIAKSSKEKTESRLRALDMAIRMTTGYAPTKSINANFNGDKLYDQKIFSDGAPPEID